MRIRIVKTPEGQDKFLSTWHPTEKRVIAVGDEFEVDKIKEWGTAYYKDFRGNEDALISRWFVRVVEIPTPKVCDCPMDVLMGKGCQCGGT